MTELQLDQLYGSTKLVQQKITSNQSQKISKQLVCLKKLEDMNR